MDSKTQQIEALTEQINEEQLERQQVQQQIPGLTKKSAQYDEDILKYQEKLKELMQKLPKVEFHRIQFSSLMHLNHL